ncbi:glycosyltransferase [Spirosoma soli]|uniref:Glycosyltransferase n=1 Tax=Spirosoma soli TaxID=1770529 RepID=A0ABW5M1T1_9BACT
MSILYVIYLFFLGYIAFTVLYITAFAIAGRIGRADDIQTVRLPNIFRKIAVLIPAYKEDAVIVESVLVNLKQSYPTDRFDLIVIADSLQPTTLAELATLPIKVLEVSFEVSTVTKAINEALNWLPEGRYDIALVSDADNHMAPDFLMRVNTAFEHGWQAVQGHRVAKNTNTSVAVLDAISEEINNHIFRKGSRALGLSSSIIGSGMAIDFKLMKAAMTDLHTIGGYDKELEKKIVLSGVKIGYLEQAFIYDEKVANRAVFEKQRTRWIAAQWQFLKFYSSVGISELLKGRIASAFKFIQAFVLPRVMLLGLLAVCTCVGLLSSDVLLWGLPLVSLITLCISLVISVPFYLWKRVTLRELLLIPALMLNFAKAIFNMRKAFKSFIHTPHQTPIPVDKIK